MKKIIRLMKKITKVNRIEKKIYKNKIRLTMKREYTKYNNIDN